MVMNAGRLKLRICLLLSLAVFLLCQSFPLRGQAPATAKKPVHSDADLPRFTYPLAMPPSEFLVADDSTFKPFLQKVGTDVESVLDEYDIQDKATLRKMLGGRRDVEMLSGNATEALQLTDRVRELQDKPAARATSGMILRAVLQAADETHSTSGEAFQAAFQRHFAEIVNALPWDVVQDTVKQSKGSYQIVSANFYAGSLRADADPQFEKSKTIDFDTALNLVGARLTLKRVLPARDQIESVLTAYIRAHTKQKPDIWAARSVTLTKTEKLTPVRIGIWDSGVDTSLFPDQLYTDPAPNGHSAHGLAFDVNGKLYAGDLQPLTEERKQLYPKVLDLLEGFSDLQSNIDSPAADNTRKYLASTPPAELAKFLKELDFLGQYTHGTHVAGIAVAGNPAARLVVGQFYDQLPEIPFPPTVEWAEHFKTAFQQLGDYFREHNVRVVNMSWGDDVAEFELWLAKTSTEKDPAARKKQAEQIYAVWKDAVASAILSAPNTLFVCAAGNSNSDAGFLGDVPVSLNLPNLVAVGAVDQAGEETSFTSYGPMVVLDSDGFQVESVVPGGRKMKYSGTSMASPNVVNVAAKLIALDPSLTPQQTIALMRKGADTSPSGRLHVINPKATIALLQQGGH